MVRKLAYLLIILAVLTAAGELCGLLLPTLSWPFTVSREMSMLHIVCADHNNSGLLTPQGKFLWFGWACVLVMAGAGLWIRLKGPRRFRPTPITKRRLQRFKSISRGYVSLVILLALTLLACMDQCLVGKRALLVIQDGSWYFPAIMRKVYKGSTFGQTGDFADAEANYRELKKQAGQPGKPSLVVMPLVPYDPTGDSTNPGSEALVVNEEGLVCEADGKPYSGLASRLHKDEEALPHISYKFRKGKKVDRATGWLEDRTEVYSATYENNKIVAEHYNGPGTKEDFLKQTDENKISRIFYHPAPPLKGGHLLGTNTQGADILAYLYGGLQVNMKAAIFYLPIVYFIGITFGMMMGYFGGMFDLGMQRLIEIFSQVPFLFIIMIISDMVPLHMKGMFLIISLLIMFGWMSMTYQLRTSTMKEKARDYVAAARVVGASTNRILFVHILPNLVAILVTLVPFSVSALILALASLDYLGFGLPDTYASWGRLLNDGLADLSASWVVTSAFSALVITLLLVTFIGEAVREAFDPKKFTTYK